MEKRKKIAIGIGIIIEKEAHPVSGRASFSMFKTEICYAVTEAAFAARNPAAIRFALCCSSVVAK